MNPYRILVTGVGISGKSNLSKCLEEDLSQYFDQVINKDVDWDEDALVVPPNSRIYILQTAKGCRAEAEHQISLSDFDRILYSDPSIDTYLEFLASRGYAWFREGIVDKGLDTDPKPYSNEKLPAIIRRIASYASRREKLRNEDLIYFSRPELISRVEILRPMIMGPNSLSFEGYPKVLEQIVKEVNLKKDGN